MPTCKQCREQFNRGRRDPLRIHCGHTFCRSCLEAQEKGGAIRCHICKRTHTGPSVNQLHLNEDMLDEDDGGASQTLHDESGLMAAVTAGRVERVLKLIWRGADVDAPSADQQYYGMRPLHLASECGHEGVVWILLRANVTVDAPNHEGMTSLHLACRAGHLAVVTLLLMHGADPLLQVKGLSAVHLASSGGHVGILREICHRCPEAVHLLTPESQTPLHLAADKGNMAVVRWLVGKGLDLGTRDCLGRTALDCGRQKEHGEIVQYLSNVAPGHLVKEDSDEGDDEEDDGASGSSGGSHNYEDQHPDPRQAPGTYHHLEGPGQPSGSPAQPSGSPRRSSDTPRWVPGMPDAEAEDCIRAGQRAVAREIEGVIRQNKEAERQVRWQEEVAGGEIDSGDSDSGEPPEAPGDSDRMYGARRESGEAGTAHGGPSQEAKVQRSDSQSEETQTEEHEVDYEILQRLSKGDFGETWLVRRHGTTQLLRTVQLSEVPARTRVGVQKEVKLLRQLAHPHIIQVTDGWTSGGRLYIFTEHCIGGTLARRIQTNAPSQTFFTQEQILEWSVSLAQALAYLHRRDIIHRDVTPANLLLAAEDVLKLANFSLARFMDTKMADTYIGTPVYMSPEILKGDLYNTKTDMWSMGCCLYELATLHSGYPYTKVKVKGKYNKRLKETVKDLLNKDPKKRPSALEILKRPMFKEALEKKVMKEHECGRVYN